jgi:hypothetical protein
VLSALVLNFDAKTASYICSQLNSVAGEIPVVGSIIELMSTVFEKIDEAQSNEEMCQDLGRRIFELGLALKTLLKRGKHAQTLAGPLRTLHRQLLEASDFVSTFSRRGWLAKFFWGKNDADEFEELDKKLTQTVSDAHFQVGVAMMVLQTKTYAVVKANNSQQAELNAIISKLVPTSDDDGDGKLSMAEISRDVILAQKIAAALNVGVEEVQGEANYDTAKKLEERIGKEYARTQMPVFASAAYSFFSLAGTRGASRPSLARDAGKP